MTVNLLKKILIAFIFAVPVIGFVITPNNYVIKSENRMITQFPMFGTKIFFEELQKYFNDRLFLKLYTNEHFYKDFNEHFTEFTGTGIFTVKGLHGWLFLGNVDNRVYDQHSAEVPVSYPQLQKKIALLSSLKSLSESPFYLVVGPDKHGIYPEFMNQNINYPGKYRYFNHIRPYLEDAGITVIDNYDAEWAAKDPENKTTLYYSDDTHWNLEGAHVAFENVMKQVLPDYSPIEYRFEHRKHINGDLVRNIKNPEKDTLDDAIVTNYQNKTITVRNLKTGVEDKREFSVNNKGEHGIAYINDNAVSDKTILMISDSFGESICPFAVDYFKEVFFVHRKLDSKTLIDNLIQNNKFDLILYINVERDI